MFMIEITVIDVESKKLHKMEETKEKETKEKMKLSTIRIVVISETNMSTDRKAQKESYASTSVGILFLLHFVFALKMSVAG